MKRKVLLSTLFLILHFTVALAQQVTISGQVLDEKSEPLIGATINIEGTTNAVITDLEGKFTIKVLPSEKLVIWDISPKLSLSERTEDLISF